MTDLFQRQAFRSLFSEVKFLDHRISSIPHSRIDLVSSAKTMDKATAIGLGSGSLAVAVLGKVGYDITKDAQTLAKERDGHTIDEMTALARQNIKNGRVKHEADEHKKTETWKAERMRFLEYEKQRHEKQQKQQRQMKLKKENEVQQRQQLLTEHQIKRQQELRRRVENSV